MQQEEDADVRRLLEELEETSGPIVYHPGGWENSVPSEIKAQVLLERMALVLQGEELASDAEAICYLYTYSLSVPMDGEWTEIYSWLVTQWRPELKEVLDSPEQLTEQQMDQILQMKRHLRETSQRMRKQSKEETMPETLTIIMKVRDDSVAVGVGKDGHDPVMTRVAGGLAEVLPTIPTLVEEANAQWEVSKQNPAYKAPKAPRATGKATAPPAAAPQAAVATETPEPEA
ncbi:hypothetical protein LCGC14_3013530, partial [marine sediment metagenome]